MRPTSVIFLVISVIMVIFGVTVCSVAGNLAESEGIMLFPEYDSDNDYVIASDIGSLGTTKIDITAADADVNIIGGSERSYIEVVNFKANYYTLSAKDKNVIFTEIPDLESMLKFWENGFSFTGMRNILIRNKAELGRKAINVYITNEELKQVKLHIEKGNISISNISAKAEFEINLTEGTITLDRVNTTDYTVIKGDNVNMNFTRSRFKSLTVELTSTVSVFRKSNSTSMDISFTDGSFDCDNINNFYSVTAKAETGSITVDGVIFQRTYTRKEESAPEEISVITKNGDVTLSLGDADSETQK